MSFYKNLLFYALILFLKATEFAGQPVFVKEFMGQVDFV